MKKELFLSGLLATSSVLAIPPSILANQINQAIYSNSVEYSKPFHGLYISEKTYELIYPNQTMQKIRLAFSFESGYSNEIAKLYYVDVEPNEDGSYNKIFEGHFGFFDLYTLTYSQDETSKAANAKKEIPFWTEKTGTYFPVDFGLKMLDDQYNKLKFFGKPMKLFYSNQSLNETEEHIFVKIH